MKYISSQLTCLAVVTALQILDLLSPLINMKDISSQLTCLTVVGCYMKSGKAQLSAEDAQVLVRILQGTEHVRVSVPCC